MLPAEILKAEISLLKGNALVNIDYIRLLGPTVGVVNGHPESLLFGAIKFDTPGPGVLVLIQVLRHMESSWTGLKGSSGSQYEGVWSHQEPHMNCSP